MFFKTENNPINATRHLLRPPQFENKRLTLQARIVFYVNLAGLFFCSLLMAYSMGRDSTTWLDYMIVLGFMIGLGLNLVLLSLKRLEAALWGTATVIYAPTLLIVALNRGFNDVLLQIVYPLFIYISLFLRKKGLWVFGLFTLCWIGLIWILQINNYYVIFISPITFNDEIVFSLIMLVSTIFVMNFLINNTVIANDELDRNAEIAEIANTQKSQFLANMSHELRTPLNAIIGYSDGLLEEHDDIGNLDHMTVEDINRIRSAGIHLLGLINEVLDLSKIEANQMLLYIGLTDVEHLIALVMDTIHPLAEKGGNQLLFDNRLTTTQLHLDSKKVSQILINLMSNAAKFTENGEIKLIAQNKAEQNSLIFVVEDSGIGIPPDAVETIFDAFKQVDDSHTRKTTGTGLGLTITKRFVDLMGGTISIESEIGVGTRFIVDIPTPHPHKTDPLSDQIAAISKPV